MKKHIALMGAGVGILFLTAASACSVGQDALLTTVGDMVDKGYLTPEQGSEMVAGIMEWAKAQSGSQFLDLLGAVAGSVIFSLTGVRLWRGGVDSRKGAAPAPKAPAPVG